MLVLLKSEMQFMLKTLPSRSRYSISVNNASVDGAVTKEQVDDFVKTKICEFLHFIHLLYIFGKAGGGNNAGNNIGNAISCTLL